MIDFIVVIQVIVLLKIRHFLTRLAQNMTRFVSSNSNSRNNVLGGKAWPWHTLKRK